jgi:hypothetical protein
LYIYVGPSSEETFDHAGSTKEAHFVKTGTTRRSFLVIDEVLVRVNDFDALVVRLIALLLRKLLNQEEKDVALQTVKIWPFIMCVPQTNVYLFLEQFKVRPFLVLCSIFVVRGLIVLIE